MIIHDSAERLARLVSQKTGLSEEDARKGIAEVPETPVGEGELSLASKIDRTGKLLQSLDRYVEERKPEKNEKSLEEIAQFLDGKARELNLSKGEMQEAAYSVLAMENATDPSKTGTEAALTVETVEPGLFLTFLHKAVPEDPSSKQIADLVENTPSSVLYVDTTPGEPGWLVYRQELPVLMKQ